MLTIAGLTVSVDAKPVLRGVDLALKPGTTYALMGPNGSGKSTLAGVLMGHPDYTIMGGTITWNGRDLLTLPVHERSKAGLFLAFQHPYALPGVHTVSFLREICRAHQGIAFSETVFQQELTAVTTVLAITPAQLERNLNEGFSGGEKKRFELLQILMLKPQLIILDEIDSGLDIDALKIVARALEYIRMQNPSVTVLVITHYQRLLEQVVPDRVHILMDGRIVDSGSISVITSLESQGYDQYAGR